MSTDRPIKFEERKEECNPLVLVIDDDQTHRSLMQLLADRLEITAQCVGSCAEAMAALEMFSFDLILMDVRMPDVDGLICTRRIRELSSQNAKKIPIIAVTANVMPGDMNDCLKAGMDDYLAKPFTLEQLHEMLCRWLKQRAAN